MPANQQELDFHQRLKQKADTVFSEICTAHFARLIDKFRKKYRKMDQAIVCDKVTDVLLSLKDNPDQYDPEKKGLFSYLCMAIEGDLKNELDRTNRQRKKDSRLVEELKVFRNSDMSSSLYEKNLSEKWADETLNELFPRELDRKIAELILDRFRETERYAEILNITNLSVENQRVEVKKHKDRIKKVLERAKVKIKSS